MAPEFQHFLAPSIRHKLYIKVNNLRDPHKQYSDKSFPSNSVVLAQKKILFQDNIQFLSIKKK